MIGNNMERRVRQRGIDDIHEFELTHGRPEKSRTPLDGYNPKKAMKQAEREYLASRGIVKKSLLERVRDFFVKPL